MIIEKIRNSQVSTLGIFLVTGLVFWLKAFFYPGQEHFPFDDQYMPLYDYLFGWLFQYPLLSVFFGWAVTFFLGFLVSRFNEKFNLIERRNYFSPLLFILLSSSLIPLQRLHPALLAAVFLLLGLEKIFDSNRNSDVTSHIFDSGFLLAIGSLFYFNVIFLMLVLWAGILVVRPFSLREWVVSIIGLVTPYILFVGFFFFLGREKEVFHSVYLNMSVHNPLVFLNLGHLLFFSFALMLVLLSSVDMLKAFNQKKIRIRKYFKVFFWFFIFSIGLLVFHPAVSVEAVVFMTIPVSFLLSNYFTYIKKIRFADILLMAFLFLLSYAQW